MPAVGWAVLSFLFLQMLALPVATIIVHFTTAGGTRK